MKRIITILFRPALFPLCFVYCAILTSAQTGQEGIWDVPRSGGETITEPSPEATAMRRYQDFPVSYASGKADISIPLIELENGALSLPIGLSYHTGGIKKTDISTYVGLGWSLTGLGQVSRQINGWPDEWKGSATGQPIRFSMDSTYRKFDFYKEIVEGKLECEYDIYNYSFPGV